MHKHDIWQVIPYVLPIISYLIGKSKGKLQVPAKIRALMENQQVMDTIIKGIDTAQSMKNMTDEQKREYVRAWGKSELYGVLGEWLPDSAINFLIEHTIAKRKG
jgi:hypothetical protein